MCSSAFAIKLGNIISNVKKSPIPEGTPQNSKAATGNITFNGSVSNGETVTIGEDVYEFDTDGSVEEGNIQVDVSGGDTASDAAAALNTAINEDGTEPVTAEEDETDDAVIVTYDIKGEVGNSVETTETVTNATWENETLTGGQNGTEGEKWQQYVDENYIYVAIEENTVNDDNWKRISLSTF